MTQPVSTEEPEVREITFRDRALWTKLPKAEQIVVWQRMLTTVERLEKQPPKDASEVIRLAVRTRGMIDAVLVNEADKIWVDDLMLEGELPLNEAILIVMRAIEAFKPEGNREQRRAAAPAKRARRKAAPAS